MERLLLSELVSRCDEWEIQRVDKSCQHTPFAKAQKGGAPSFVLDILATKGWATRPPVALAQIQNRLFL